VSAGFEGLAAGAPSGCWRCRTAALAGGWRGVGRSGGGCAPRQL